VLIPHIPKPVYAATVYVNLGESIQAAIDAVTCPPKRSPVLMLV